MTYSFKKIHDFYLCLTTAVEMVWGLCTSSRRPCRNYLTTYWPDPFKISFVASPGQYPQTVWEFLKKKSIFKFFQDFFFFFRFRVIRVNIGPYGDKTFKTLLPYRQTERWEINVITILGNHIWRVKWHHHIWPWVTLKVKVMVTQICKPYIL